MCDARHARYQAALDAGSDPQAAAELTPRTRQSPGRRNDQPEKFAGQTDKYGVMGRVRGANAPKSHYGAPILTSEFAV
jgi:hypothetical protein